MGMVHRSILCVSLTLASHSARAQASLHLHPSGTIAEGSFVLAGKVFPLPDGKFRLVYQDVFRAKLVQTGNSRMVGPEGRLARVGLVRSDGPVLQIAVSAQANLDNSVNWTTEPCKRTDTYLQVDRLQTHGHRADCLMVNHQVNFLRNPSGFWAMVRDALLAEHISLPLPVVLNATITRIEYSEHMSVSYWVNPLAYGFSDDKATRWASSSWHRSRISEDAEKAAFMTAFGGWATQLMPAVGDGFQGKPVTGKLPQLELPRKK